MSIQVETNTSIGRAGKLMLDYIDSMQDILKRPSRPAGDNLCPDLFGDGIVGIEQTPVRTRFRFDPFEIFDLAPTVFVVGTVMIQGLDRVV